MKSNPVVHFEMPLTDKKRAKKFYETAFGWEMQLMGEEYGGYMMAMTTPSTEKGPKKPGAINGGFYEKTKTSKSTHLVVSVEDLEKQMKVVKKAGGKVLGKPMDIPGVGNFVMIHDSEGNRVGMLQPIEM